MWHLLNKIYYYFWPKQETIDHIAPLVPLEPVRETDLAKLNLVIHYHKPKSQ